MKKFTLKFRCGLFYALLFLLLIPHLTFAQNADIKVTGTVKDVKGSPLPGVSVKIKDTNLGTQTLSNGSFSITAKTNSTLVFTLVGYNKQEIPVNNNAVISVLLTENNQSLDEVVVVAYGTQKKATITGAISTVSSEDIVRTPAIAATSALVGKIAGVTARTTDARPGNGATINIRNLGNPLYVIDGVAYSNTNATDPFGLNTQQSGVNAFNQLGLDDIESVTVLKDASASIYGLAAGNGVVLVTTKRGKKTDVPKIGVNAYYGIQNYTRFPYPSTAGQYVLAQDQSVQNLGGNPASLYSATELAAWTNQSDKAHLNNDYYKAVLRPNVSQSNLNANVSGGSKNSQYYLSIGNVNQGGIIKDFYFKRTNLQSNISSTIANGLTVGAQISGRQEHTHNVGVPGLDDYFNPLLSIESMLPTEKQYANDNPAYINQTHNVNVNPATYKENVTGFTDDIVRGVSIKLNAEYAFKFGLTVKGIYAYDFTNEDFDNFEYTYNAYIYNPKSGNYDNRPTLADGITPDPSSALYGNQNPFHETHRRNVISTFSQISLNYAHQFGDHSLSAVVAYEQRDTKNNYLATHTVPPNNIIGIQYLADLDFFQDVRTEEAFEGVAMRLNYDYKKRYIVEAVGRYDGSYLYQPGQQHGFFPGVTAGWRLSEEPFFKRRFANSIDNLKLRVSYGQTGTTIVNGTLTVPNAFDYLAGYNVNNGSAVFGGAYYSGVRPRGLPTTNLSWTKNSMANIGIDYGLFHSVITGTIDVYQRRRTGLPAAQYDIVLPSEVGYTLPLANLNSDITQGFDASINYNGHAGRVNYSIGGNATIGRTKNNYIYKPRFGNSYDQWRNGQTDRWAGVNFGHHIVGQFTSQAQINSYPVNIDGQNNRTLLPGDFIYEDYNHDGVINALDARPIGYAEGALPYFNYGINGRV
ncbi:MAG: TonB-dependent receptor plug, partial [Mucilaginibacter sp.]|nr:TonB-dependent receptor plug [Mucilaginibacter sp.]